MENLDNRGNSAKVPVRFSNTTDFAGAQDMKNVYEVLRQKEMELTRLEKEVEALRLVAPLLSEEKENGEASKSVLPTAVNGPQAARITVPSRRFVRELAGLLNAVPIERLHSQAGRARGHGRFFLNNPL